MYTHLHRLIATISVLLPPRYESILDLSRVAIFACSLALISVGSRRFVHVDLCTNCGVECVSGCSVRVLRPFRRQGGISCRAKQSVLPQFL